MARRRDARRRDVVEELKVVTSSEYHGTGNNYSYRGRFCVLFGRGQIRLEACSKFGVGFFLRLLSVVLNNPTSQ